MMRRHVNTLSIVNVRVVIGLVSVGIKRSAHSSQLVRRAAVISVEHRVRHPAISVGQIHVIDKNHIHKILK